MRYLTAVVTLMIMFSGCKKAEQPVAPANTPPPQPPIVTVDAPYDATNYLVTRRANFMRELPFLPTLGGFTEYTAEYFSKLTARKKRVIAWAAEAKPELTFIGQTHIEIEGGNTPQFVDRVNFVQNWIFDQLLARQSTTDLVTFEQYGTDEPVTLAVMAKVTLLSYELWRTTHPELPPLSHDEALVMISETCQADARFLRQYTTPPLFCGEEWPLMFESNLHAIVGSLEGRQRDITENLIEALNHLRSEIIVLRTLEFLQRTGGTRAIIIQGSRHQYDMPDIMKKYGVSITVLLPPP